MMRDRRCRRWCLSLLLVFGCLPLSGCNFLINEFTWLDRVPPPSFDPADADAGP